MNNNRIKDEALGMPHGTAGNRLRKAIMYKYVRQASEHFCFKCGAEIEMIDELSIEHKQPWLYSENPTELFFDLDNIAFSHVRCNRPHSYSKPIIYDKGAPGTAWCSSCQDYVSRELFAKNNIRRSGINARCQPCTNKEKRLSRAAARTSS